MTCLQLWYPNTTSLQHLNAGSQICHVFIQIRDYEGLAARSRLRISRIQEWADLVDPEKEDDEQNYCEDTAYYYRADITATHRMTA